MLPKKKRLSRKHFAARPLRRAAFDYGSVHFLRGAPRAAVVVSKKICARSVDRNALRRRVYAALQSLLPLVQNTLVVYPNKKALAAPFLELKAAIRKTILIR